MDFILDTRILAAIVAGLFGISIYLMDRRYKRLDLSLRAQSIHIAEINTVRASELKEIELSNHSAHNAGQIMFQKFVILKREISELKALLYLHFDEQGPFDKELQKQIHLLTASISLWVSPRGTFNEEFVMQLGHIREFFMQGGDYWKSRINFIGAFDMNCWMLIDAEYDQVIETLMSGELPAPRQLTPYKPEYVLP